jgi:hypothetical protein
MKYIGTGTQCQRSTILYKTGNGNAMAEVYKEAIQGILMSPIISGKSLPRFMAKLA